MKRAFFAVTAFLVAVLVIATNRSHDGAAVAAVPTPAAFAYDEIYRMVMPPATPPAPGTFQTDYQAIVASASQNGGSDESTPAPHHGLFGGLMNSVMSGNPAEMMQRLTMGTLTRYTYYKGWIRTDDPVSQTAVIEKCQEHQYINLNLAKKTYSIENTQPPCKSTMPAMGSHGGSGNAAPGTVDMTVKATATNLGALTIDGIGTTGTDNAFEMSMTNATGSCQNMNMSMKMTQYVSSVGVPRPYCPLPRTMGGPVGMISQGGCQPRMHAQVQGMGMFGGGNGKLVMWSLMQMGSMNNAAMSANMKGGGMLTERGNVKWFSGADADALFSIPPGFTQQN